MKRLRTWMLVLSVVAFTAAPGGLGLPPAHRFVLSSESRVWIDGSSTVNAFTCEAAEVEGSLLHASPDVAPASDVQPASLRAEAQGVQAVLTVPVRTFMCGQRRMERDLYTTLKADTYPDLRYELTAVEALTTPKADTAAYELRALGRLTVAGATRAVETSVRGHRLPDGRLHASGSQPLMMTDFGIAPPTALLGLIQVRDHLVVRFDLVATPAAAFSTE